MGEKKQLKRPSNNFPQDVATMSQACPKHAASDFLWSEMLRHGCDMVAASCDIIFKVLQENFFSHVATIFSVFCDKAASRCGKLATCLRHG